MTVETRGNYKAVWTGLSETYQSAVRHVIGEVDEPVIQATASQTLGWLEQTVGVHADDVILEIGCGIGRVGQVLAPRCKEWIGCDVSPNMLDHARQRLADFPNVRLVEISGFDLAPIPDASVDVVYCTVVFMHLDGWERFGYIAEAGRVLKPGGRIFVDNFNLCSDEGWGVFEHDRRILPARYRPPYAGHASTPPEIATYLHRAGFQQVQIAEEGTWVQGYAVKPTDGSMDPILAYERGVREGLREHERAIKTHLDNLETITPKPPHPAELRVQELEQIIAVKNAHIQTLERLIARLENGRAMRILHWLGRMRG